MVIKGLLITLENDQQRADSALELLQARNDTDLGELQDKKWLPLVLESETDHESKDTIKWIESLDGVEYMDPIFATVDGGNFDLSEFSKH